MGMSNIESDGRRRGRAFTLVELLVVIGIIGILAALIFPVLGRVSAKARRAACLNNLRQVNLATRMYADEHEDALILAQGFIFYSDWHSYKASVKSYLGLKGAAARTEKIFICPADTFIYLEGDLNGGPPWKGLRVNQGLCEASWTGFNSYAFNGGNRLDKQFADLANPGIAGIRLAAVNQPSKTLLIFEASARLPYSWHRPEVDGKGYYRFDDSRNMLSFVDGHASFSTMYWNHLQAACMYDPPERFGYKWSGD
jgi:prepilin-type N-terminal cleavage/methylation domain-containing protein